MKVPTQLPAHVTASPCMDTSASIDSDRRGGVACRSNIEHLVGDATELDLEEESADVVFSNWLLMYLDDDEVADLASDALAWVSCLPHPCRRTVCNVGV